MRRAVFASEDTFTAFYRRALPRVYGYLLSRCSGDAGVAEELTQQAFEAAVRQRHAFDGRSDPVSWLISIARHKLVDHFREIDRQERRRMRLVVREVAMDREGHAWRLREERERIERTLARLPALQRAALILHYADGLPVRDVAARIGRTESATESLMSRGRQTFKRMYMELDDE